MRRPAGLVYTVLLAAACRCGSASSDECSGRGCRDAPREAGAPDGKRDDDRDPKSDAGDGGPQVNEPHVVAPGRDRDAGDAGGPELDPNGCTPWDGSQVHAEFEVPGAMDATRGDYFRLPFPNDIRRNDDGTIDLRRFPVQTPLAQLFVDALDGVMPGFGTYQTITLRFSGVLDYDGLDARVALLDVTNPEAAEELGRTFLYDAGGGLTVCHDSLSIRVPNGRPLTPGHTYVAGVKSGLLDERGRPVVSTPHFTALLGEGAPDDPVLARAHAAYAPFRRYLAAAGQSPEDWLIATVFTTLDPSEDMRRLASRVYLLEAPPVTAWARCGTDASPCSDLSGSRDCGGENAAYEEFHALVRLPIFQRGDAPYLQSGGDIDPDDVVREEDVCLALAVPRAQAPEGGFPLVVFGHGAGGSFRSALVSDVAERLATATDGASNARPVAVLGFDQVAHGPRRGSGPGSSFDPELLLFNLLNPASARGTTLQAGADVVSIGRAARSVEFGAELGVAFDTAHLAYWGHSQGGSQGAIALPYTDDFVGAVFSGTGAGMIHALLERTQPKEIPLAVRDSVGDPGPDGELVRGGVYHPTLSLLQAWVDGVDPLNFARHLVRAPLEGHRPKDAFAPYGIGDTYAPKTNLVNFLVQAGLQGVTPHASADPAEDLGPELAPPLSGNVVWRSEEFTAGFRQYRAPTNDDGHFVAFSAEAAEDDVVRFLVQTVYGELPEVGSLD